jgi:hypothetical protein
METRLAGGWNDTPRSGSDGLHLEEHLHDVLGELFGLTKLAWIFAKGFLDGKGVVVCDTEVEVADFAVERWVTCHSETFCVVEDDDGVLIKNACIEPREAAAGDLDLAWADGLKDGVGGGDVALQLPLDLVDVIFKADDEGDKERFAFRCDDLQLMLGSSVVFCRFVALLLDFLCEVGDPLFAHACDDSSGPIASEQKLSARRTLLVG